MAKGSNKEYITKTTLNEAVDAILNGINNMVKDLKSEMNTCFDGVENRLRSVEVELSHVKDEINGLKAVLSDTPPVESLNK